MSRQTTDCPHLQLLPARPARPEPRAWVAGVGSVFSLLATVVEVAGRMAPAERGPAFDWSFYRLRCSRVVLAARSVRGENRLQLAWHEDRPRWLCYADRLQRLCYEDLL